MGVEQLDTMKCSIAGRPYSIDNATLDSGAEGIGTIFTVEEQKQNYWLTYRHEPPPLPPRTNRKTKVDEGNATVEEDTDRFSESAAKCGRKPNKASANCCCTRNSHHTPVGRG